MIVSNILTIATLLFGLLSAISTVWLQGIYRAPATAEEQANWVPARP